MKHSTNKGFSMDVVQLLSKTKTPAQVLARLLLIRTLQKGNHIRLSGEDFERLLDKCEEICHKTKWRIELYDEEDDEE